MAQFDVHRNTGKQRETIPYVVLVQSALFDAYRRRVALPLVRLAAIGTVSHPSLNPIFEIENVAVVLHPLDIVSVAHEQLGEFVVSLAEEGDRIAAALDELLTRAWG